MPTGSTWPGCLEGDCHFKNGNVKAARRVAYLKKLLDEIGMGGERVEMITMSAGMGERFAQTASDFTEKIRRLGPIPVKAPWQRSPAALRVDSTQKRRVKTMITAERKPMEELIECVRPYRRILLVGCNECVTVCAAGGRKEVGLLSSALQMPFMKEGKVLDDQRK